MSKADKPKPDAKPAAKPDAQPEAKPVKVAGHAEGAPPAVVTVRRRSIFRRLASGLAMLALVIALLVILGVGVTWGVLQTNVPRDIVTGTIGSIAKLDVEAEAVDVGLTGGVQVRNLTARLPTEDQPLLTLEAASLELPPLPVLAFQYLTGKPQVNRVEASGIDLYARQLPDGRYNLQQVAEQLTAGGSSGQPSGGGGGGPLPIALPLPDVDVDGVTLHVETLDGERADVEGLAVTGRSVDRLLYGLKVRLPDDRLYAVASLVPAGNFPHEVAVHSGGGLTSLLEPVVELPVEGLRFDLRLDGRHGEAYRGRVVVDHAAAAVPGGDVRVRQAVVDVAALVPDGPLARAEIVGFTGELPQVGPVAVTDGAVTFDGTLLAEGVVAELLGGDVAVDVARFDPATTSGRVEAVARNLSYAGQEVRRGTVEAAGGLRPDGRFSASVAGTLAGTIVDRPVVANYDVTAGGPSLLKPSVTAEVADAGGEQAVPATTLRAGADLTGSSPVVVLQTLSVGDGLLDVSGKLADGAWRVEGTSRGLRLEVPRLPEDRNMVEPAGEFVASGSLVAGPLGYPVVIERARGTASGYVLNASGIAHVGVGTDVPPNPPATLPGVPALAEDTLLGPVPFRLDVDLRPDPDAPASGEQVVRGDVTADLSLDGTLAPRQVTLTGRASGQNLVVGDTPLDDFSGDLDGELDEDGLRLATRDVRAFGGMHEAVVRWPFRGSDGRQAPLTATYTASGVKLAQLADLAGVEASGNVESIRVEVTAPRLELDAVRSVGEIDVAPAEGRELVVLGQNVAERAEVRFTTQGTVLDVNRAAVFNGDGEIVTTARIDLASPDRVELTADGREYPLTFATPAGDVRLLVRAVGSDGLVVSNLTGGGLPNVDGSARVEADVQFKGDVRDAAFGDLAEVRADVTAEGDVLALDALRVDLLTGGTIEGGGRVLLADPPRSTLEVRGRDVDFGELAGRLLARVGEGEQFEGVLNFDLGVEPATAQRAIGDLRIAAEAWGDGLVYREVDVTRAELIATLDLDEEADSPLSLEALRKLSTQKVRVEAAGGVTSGFVRLTRRELKNVDGTESVFIGTKANLFLGRDDYVSGRTSTNDVPASRLRPLNVETLVRGANATPDFKAWGEFTGDIYVNGNAAPLLFGPQRSPAEEREGMPSPTLGERIAQIGGSGVLNLSKLTTAGKLGKNARWDRDDRLGGGTVRVSFGSRLTEREQEAAAEAVEGPAASSFEAGPILELVVTDMDVTTNTVNARGTATISDLLNPDGRRPIDGTVIVLAKPLEEIGLPFANSAGDVLSALQGASGLNAYNVSGTLNEPQVSLKSLDEIGDATKNLLVQDAKDGG